MIKVSQILSFRGVLFVVAIIWQASLSANTVFELSVKDGESHREETVMPDMSEPVKNTLTKLIQIKVVELTDNSGLIYLGAKVGTADLELYLSQMKNILGDDFALYRQYQSARDHQTFHMTLINPYEYQALAKGISVGETLSVSLSGLGRVKQGNKTTYFVVAQSTQAANYRQNLALTKKDFHITLGFYPSDIYGVNKGRESLIEQKF